MLDLTRFQPRIQAATPMLAMGDELGRTQGGNNNAYAQDNATSWIDWADADTALVRFVAGLVALRRDHPALRADRWLSGRPCGADAFPDVEWRHPGGRPMTPQDWTHPHGHALVAVLCAPGEDGRPADRVTLGFNAGRSAVAVRWPPARPGFRWSAAVDTSVATGFPAQAEPHASLPPRAMVVLVEAAAP